MVINVNNKIMVIKIKVKNLELDPKTAAKYQSY